MYAPSAFTGIHLYLGRKALMFNTQGLIRAGVHLQVHLSGDARWAWTHGTRVGLPVDHDKALKAAAASKSSVPVSPYSLHDFFGLHSSLVARGAERHSVVFAFGEGPPQTSSSQ